MKKVIPVLLLPLLFGLSYGESMKFVTVLSSPVGSFNKLEAVDPKTPAKGSTVNFCTKVGRTGEVQLKGTNAADLKEVVLSSNTTLGKTDSGKYSLSQIKLHKDGYIKGGRLLGNTLTVSQPTTGSSKNLYGTKLIVAGGKTKTLNVNNGASQITEQHGATEMVWSNEYQSDTACGNTATCAKQYLLKGKGSAVSCSGASSRACGCDDKFMKSKKGTQTRTCNSSTGTWSEWSACVGFTEWDRQQCAAGGDEEWQCVYNSARDSWGWVQRLACQGGAEPDDDCTWQSVGTFPCGDSGRSMAADFMKNQYSGRQCSIEDYCPGGGIQVECCL